MIKTALYGLPFVVGITGHRNPEDRLGLAADLKVLFRRLSETVPDCRPVFLSALAAGADQIAAKVALDLGWDLVAILPFEPSDPRHGFSEIESAAFDDLLEKATYWIDAGAIGPITPNSDAPTGSDDAHFLAAGQYIAHASHVLVSAWDGLQNEAIGGTADITRYRLNMPTLRIDSQSLMPLLEEWRLVVLVPTRRNGQTTSTICVPGWYKTWRAVDAATPEFSDTLQTMRTFESLNAASKCIANAKRLQTTSSDILESFSTAVGELADNEGNWLRKHWKMLFSLAVAAILTAGLYGDLKDHLPVYLPKIALSVYLISIFLLWYMIRRGTIEAEQRKPWDWRLLREILRVLRVWRFTDHHEEVSGLSLIMGARNQVPDWVIYAYRSLAIYVPGPYSSQPADRNLDYANEWIEEQIKYFNDKICEAKRLNFLKRASLLTMPLGAMAATLCLGLEVKGGQENLITYLWFTAALLPGLGAAGLVLSELRSKSGLSSAALHLREKFLALRTTMQNSSEPAIIGPQVAEVGRLAIAEVCVFSESAKNANSTSGGFLS